MKSLVFTGIATTALVFALSSADASDSFAPMSKEQATIALSTVAQGHRDGGHGPMTGHIPTMPPVMGHGPMSGPMPGMPHVMGGYNGGGQHRWGPRMNGRWHGGYNAPGGWNAYRPAFRGYIMPSYWVNPSFMIGNYSTYGLRAPSSGYNWYRYYDDAVLSDQRGYVYDSVPGVQWDRYEGGYAPENDRGYEPEYGPAIRPDNQVYTDDAEVAFAAPDGSRYSYDGDWQGNYRENDNRVYDGQWNGTVTRHEGDSYPASSRPGAPYSSGDYAPPAYQGEEPRYAIPQGYERYEQCLRSNGVAGGAIGGILGAIAGNRIAGRGNRTIGTIAGAGLGGIAGVAIEKASKKCDKYAPYDDYRRPTANRYPAQRPYPQQSYPYPQQGYPQQSYPQGYQSGYYYYPQSAPMVTTVTVVPGAATTTTTTEEVTYETVYSAPRRHIVRKWKPRPKPRCTCR